MPDLSPQDLIDATDALMGERRPWETGWREVASYMLPDGPDFNQQDVPGAQRRDLIVSNFGETALEEAADGLMGLACMPGTRWKGLSVGALPEDAHDERVWLEDANDRMLAVYDNPASRFIPAIKALALEWLGFGTGALFLNGRPGRLPIFEHRPLAEIAGAEGEDGFIDETCWFFKWPAKKAYQRWGEALPKNILDAALDPRKRHEPFEFRHYVYPRLDYDGAKRDARSRPYRECWLALADKSLIEEGGFFTNPYIVGRTGKRGCWAYGRGRGVKALGNIKMLQRVARSTIQAAEKTINPPTQSPDDGVMGTPDLRPGMDNPVRPEYLMRNAGIQPITTGARPDIGMDFMEWVKQAAGDPLLRKALSLPREPRMLVDQVMAIEEEAMRAASPIVGEFQTEILGPMDGRLFDIIARDRGFAPWPDSLAGAEIQPQFEAPAARARNLGVVRAIANRNAIMGPVWQAQPELMDLHDFEREERTIGQILGIPADLYRAPEVYAAMQKARAEVAKQREEREALKDDTTALKNATPALSLIQGGKQEEAAA